jgi:hypothetical protein
MKTVLFDLEFGPTGIHSLTDQGVQFLIYMRKFVISDKALYGEAICEGLHVRFADQKTRDKLSAVSY